MERLETGIMGLDEMLNDGIPKGCVTAVIGGFGTGKSILAMKFIQSGLSKGEKCLYISMEQSEKAILKAAALFGWDFKSHITGENLKLLRLSPSIIRTTITKIQSELPGLIKNFAPKRLVIDPITLYEVIFDNEGERRDHLFTLIEMIRESETTSLIVTEASDNSPYHSRFGLIEYIADGVISLRNIRGNDLKSFSRLIEVSKMRMTDHSNEIKPYMITKDGIVVHMGAQLFSEF